MTTGRRRFATAIVLALIGTHGFELARDTEHWPIFTYPMYSGLEQERAIRSNRLVGVREDGEEVPLQAARYLYPFDQSRLADGFHSDAAGTRRAAPNDRCRSRCAPAL